jgi:hypothetical protein
MQHQGDVAKRGIGAMETLMLCEEVSIRLKDDGRKTRKEDRRKAK